MPVVAGHVVNENLLTIRTCADIMAEFTRFTHPDTVCHFLYMLRQVGVMLQVRWVKFAEYFPDWIGIIRCHKDFLRSFHFRCQGKGKWWWKKGIYAPLLP
jgi:hypothetical protein